MDKTTIAFVVTYRNTVKIIKSNVENLKDDILIKFRSYPAFPKQFIIQYENKLCNTMVDLDEPNDQKSNKINISDDSGDDGDRSATPNESESEFHSKSCEMKLKFLKPHFHLRVFYVHAEKRYVVMQNI